METTQRADQRVAVVVGGSGGIGRAVSERLAADGMAVVVHYSGGSCRAAETVQVITNAGGVATAVGGDVADEGAMAALFERTADLYGGVDVVVNTAGIMVLAPVAEFDLGDFDRMHRINVRGTFVVTQLAARHLRNGGALINFSTSITRLQTPGYAAYAATKGAVEAMTLVTAREMRGAPARRASRCCSTVRFSWPSAKSPPYQRRSPQASPSRSSPRWPPTTVPLKATRSRWWSRRAARSDRSPTLRAGR